ncbi:protein NRT1/ PTR FAMILY 4.5-like [Actinidia eriantha]|uniref:protein NRT1/ PTR FAMILY 4.5-like n=1 Tax=Actinidia eriantha TaxID=165200 RepID=UPI00258D70E1|nr:protein NRT1/ PTR FAMILY 4.5-like [Actinidia eriantha]
MGDEEATKPGYKSLEPFKKKGGFKAASFAFVYMTFESMGFVANMVSLVLYFYLQMHFDLSASANTLTNLMGSTFLLSLIGAFISDTYTNRFNTSLFFGILEILSLAIMTIQAHDQRLLPNPCGKSSCVSGGKAAILYGSLCLLALGSGGVKGALPPLGADQFDKRDPREAKALASYFNYLLFSTTIGAAVGVTVVVWVSMNIGWWLGFLICTVVTAIGFLVLGLGKPFYRLQPPGESAILRIVQVIVVSFKNRKMSLPKNAEELYEINEKESLSQEEKISHTNQFRCLDKAAILQEEAKPNSWKVCTVTQVEEVKVLTRMLPIIASTILMNTCLAQLQTFSVQQGNRMGRFLGSFEVPAPSIPVIPLAFMAVLIPIYEFIFVPFARKLTGHPSGITQLQRVGVGLVLSAVSMAVAALVEVKRRNQSIKSPLEPISLFWLSFQYGIFGIADMFTLVGLLEFFYKEAPECMRSLSTSFTWISLSLGYFLSSVFIDIINSVTKRLAPSKQGWLHGQDLDKNHLDLFYWFLAILSCLNFFNYLYWASWYKYKTEEPKMEPMILFKEGSPVEGLSRNSTNGGPSVEDKKEDAKEEKEQVGEAQ